MLHWLCGGYTRRTNAFGALTLWGGLAATLGGVMDSVQWPHLVPNVFEAHELMHLMMVFGAFCFIAFYLRCSAALPEPAADAASLPGLPA